MFDKLLGLALACTLIGGVALLACGCDDPPCAQCIKPEGSGTSNASGAGGSACDGTRGTLTGWVYLTAGPGQPNSSPAASALIALRKMPTDTPLYGMADEQGHYSIEIPPGDWIVTGEDGTGCSTDEPKTVTVKACEIQVLDLVIDLCVG